MFAFFYECLLCFLAFLSLPNMLFQMLKNGKYKSSLLAKFGVGLPAIDRAERPLIWVHAVSMGETKAVCGLAEKLKETFPRCALIVSSTTETGHEQAKKVMPFAAHHIFLPFDFSWIIRRIVCQYSPSIVIISETDFWYNFLRFAKMQGALIVLVNGKISEKSTGRHLYFPSISRKLFSLFDLFCVQNAVYAQRFALLGVSLKKLLATGNMKFDESHVSLSEQSREAFRERLHIGQNDVVIAVGSTHETEEGGIVQALAPLWAEFPSMKIILVPRHPQRFSSVAAEMKEQGLSVYRFSQAEEPAESPQIILVDAMGVLPKCYQIADIAIVAGSFTEKIGGHNILEPIYYGVPTVFGPYMFSQPELEALVLDYKAGIQVPLAGLKKAVSGILSNGSGKASLARQGERLIAENKGAAQRAYEAIVEMFEEKNK